MKQYLRTPALFFLFGMLAVLVMQSLPIVAREVHGYMPTMQSAQVISATCTSDFLLNNGICKPRILDLTASNNPQLYLGNTIAIGGGRVWSDWRNYAPLVNEVAQLTAGKSSDLEKAQAILNWVETSKPYGCPGLVSNPASPCTNSPANNNADFATIFSSSTGVCLDASIISTAMLRVAGIPAVPRMIDINHIVTMFYAGGIWYAADSTFLVNPTGTGTVSIATSSEARQRFIPFVAGELNPSDSNTGQYCDNEFCMSVPFRTNRILSNSGVKTARLTFPSIMLADYDASNQISCDLEAQGILFDTFGGFVDHTFGSKTWVLAQLAYSIPDNRNIGYITANVPVADSANSSVSYRFECRRGYTWGTMSGMPLAYADITPRLGTTSIITYKDLVIASSTSSVEFARVVQVVKSYTEDLGIAPTESPALSIAIPPAPAPTCSVNAADIATVGQATNFGWSSTNATAMSDTVVQNGKLIQGNTTTDLNHATYPITFSSPGTYTWNFRVSGSGGNGSCVKQITVAPAPLPTCTITAPTTAIVGEPLTFGWNSTGATTLAVSGVTQDDKTIQSFTPVSLSQTPYAITFSVPGKYVWTFLASGYGNKATCQKSITVTR